MKSIKYRGSRAVLYSLIVLLPLSSGCFAVYVHYPVKISVRDAETDALISKATVELGYAYFATFNAPKPVSATTDDQGSATLRAATFDNQAWNARAAGYMSTAPNSHPGIRFPHALEFRMYREPAPRLRLIVPNDYRGLLKIEIVKTSGWIQGRAGDRVFEFHPSPGGYVAIDATPLLSRIQDLEPAIDVVREDGSPVPRPAAASREPDRVCLRYLETYYAPSERLLFIIGTESDARAMDPVISQFVNGDSHSTTMNVEALNALFAIH